MPPFLSSLQPFQCTNPSVSQSWPLFLIVDIYTYVFPVHRCNLLALCNDASIYDFRTDYLVFVSVLFFIITDYIVWHERSLCLGTVLAPGSYLLLAQTGLKAPPWKSYCEPLHISISKRVTSHSLHVSTKLIHLPKAHSCLQVWSTASLGSAPSLYSSQNDLEENQNIPGWPLIKKKSWVILSCPRVNPVLGHDLVQCPPVWY